MTTLRFVILDSAGKLFHILVAAAAKVLSPKQLEFLYRQDHAIVGEYQLRSSGLHFFVVAHADFLCEGVIMFSLPFSSTNTNASDKIQSGCYVLK